MYVSLFQSALPLPTVPAVTLPSSSSGQQPLAGAAATSEKSDVSSSAPVQVDVHHHAQPQPQPQQQQQGTLRRHVQTTESAAAATGLNRSDLNEEEKENLHRNTNDSSDSATPASEGINMEMQEDVATGAQQAPLRKKGKSSSLRRADSGSGPQHKRFSHHEKPFATRKASMPATTVSSLIVSSSSSSATAQNPPPPITSPVPGSSSLSTTSFSSRETTSPPTSTRSGSYSRTVRNGGASGSAAADCLETAATAAAATNLSSSDAVAVTPTPMPGAASAAGLRPRLPAAEAKPESQQGVMLPEKEEYRIELRKDEKRGLGITVAGYVCEKGEPRETRSNTSSIALPFSKSNLAYHARLNRLRGIRAIFVRNMCLSRVPNRARRTPSDLPASQPATLLHSTDWLCGGGEGWLSQVSQES